MRIGINLLSLTSYQGTETYAENIIRSLLDTKMLDMELVIFGTTRLPQGLRFKKTDGIHTVMVDIPFWGKGFLAFYQQTVLPFLLWKNKKNILFAPSPTAPLFLHSKVVTIHDCAYDHFPEFDSKFSRIYFWLMYQGAKYFSRKIITVSEFSKRELCTLYKIPGEKIHVIYEALPLLPNPTIDVLPAVLQKFAIRNAYFFYIGNTRPRKNLDRLLLAFKEFLQQTNESYQLVVAGKIDTRFLNLKTMIEETGLGGKVILTDFVTQEEKVLLYKGAMALVFPSLYEGFGLPVLEAQSLGIPVLTSNTSSLPEIAGEGAIYVDPYSIEDIAKGMKRLTVDKELRTKLIQAGFENVKRFSWAKAAWQLQEIFLTVAKNKKASSKVPK